MPALVAPDRSWIFIHTPKTAGTWISKVLRAVVPEVVELRGRCHNRPAQLAHAGLIDQNMFSFAFVRHPLTWYWSWWRQWDPLELPPLSPSPVWRPTFEETIRVILNGPPVWSRAMVRFTTGVSRIGYYESLYDDFGGILDIIAPRWSAEALNRPRVYTSLQLPIQQLPSSVFHALVRHENSVMQKFGYSISAADITRFCGT